MTSGTSTLDAAAVLSSARGARAAANAAEARVLAAAVEWAHLHLVDDLDQAATWLVEGGRDTGVPIAGEGCPLVSEFAIGEFATALGLTEGSGRNLIAHGLELVHRLPRVWARVQDGTLAPWRARRIAEETLCLSAQAAGFVDAQLAPFAHKTGVAQTQRLVEQAIARFMPEFAAERRDRAADQRYFTIDHHQVSFTGTSRVHGDLDLADALDLEDAIAAGAQQLADLGSTQTLDARRAAAVGLLARGQQPLNLPDDRVSTGSTTGIAGDDPVSSGSTGEPGRTETGRVTGPGRARRREVVLFVHLSADALDTGDPDTVVWVENAGGRLVTAGQVAAWCGRAETDRVVVRPVIDLNADLRTDSYRVPASLAEQVELRDKTCVFPWCQRPARACDKDHVIAYDPAGPPGQTSTGNLAPLCRRHHRMKTHGGWAYSMVEPGSYLWRSPLGYSYHRDHSGTEDLTPPPVDPPPRRTS